MRWPLKPSLLTAVKDAEPVMRITSAQVIPWESPDLWGISYETDAGRMVAKVVGSKAEARAALQALSIYAPNESAAYVEEPA